MRIFVGLDIDSEIRERITCFMEGVSGFAPDARWVRPESLHITLKFIGEKQPEAVEQIKWALTEVREDVVEISFRGFGFFPNAKSARVFWTGIESGPGLARLAGNVDSALNNLGVAKEEHPYSPHLTLARAGSGSGVPRLQRTDRPSRIFGRLQEKLAAKPVPEFGTMKACYFFLYQSQLSPGGSKYSKLERFELRGV
jgi:RNA 2',3'-cyclic 3'-phosphodiesterase